MSCTIESHADSKSAFPPTHPARHLPLRPREHATEEKAGGLGAARAGEHDERGRDFAGARQPAALDAREARRRPLQGGAVEAVLSAAVRVRAVERLAPAGAPAQLQGAQHAPVGPRERHGARRPRADRGRRVVAASAVPCWLLPVRDEIAEHVARLAPQLRAKGWKLLTCDVETIAALEQGDARRVRGKLELSDHLPRHWNSPEKGCAPAC